MDASNCWQLFLETGAPELYLLYTQARRSEGSYVCDSSGISAPSKRIQ